MTNRDAGEVGERAEPRRLLLVGDAADGVCGPSGCLLPAVNPAVDSQASSDLQQG